MDGLGKANADVAVQSIVITGAGAAFSGGADIKEFGTDRAMQEPNPNSKTCDPQRRGTGAPPLRAGSQRPSSRSWR